MNRRKNSTLSGKEREFQRASYFNNLTICIEGQKNPIKPKTLDISTSGMFLNTEYLLPEGTTLEVSFTLPITHHKINARAEVRHALAGQGIGIKFIQISEEDRKAIKREMDAM
jgi:c-di-GMP-binding flagellar brake protein YcgR